ncbi:hypothetical protein M9H77_25631 [Catharanthus roseus]|uniref:Uncharacterized protein n=1 Tax=Catharanthus roseus TaxID=4058 RepID=A0ACC0AA11_CATRO|nr:hypothetical protein M9H77_25631 [Catharanthus roseus]
MTLRHCARKSELTAFLWFLFRCLIQDLSGLPIRPYNGIRATFSFDRLMSGGYHSHRRGSYCLSGYLDFCIVSVAKLHYWYSGSVFENPKPKPDLSPRDFK